MAKYYAKQISIENFDYEMYYDEECAKYDMFWAGDTDFGEINKKFINNLLNNLDSYDCDCESLEEEFDEPEAKEYYKLANYWFPKDDGSEFTEEDLRKLADCRIEFTRGNFDYYDLICKLLEIIYGKPFKNGIIKGYGQSDWMKYICPESMSDERIEWIESVLFATGTEYLISESPCNSVEELEAADDSFYDYTNLVNTEDIKAWVADSVGCKPEEVVLATIKGCSTYVKYEYEEV